jgi:hypothetical protein
MRDPVSKKGFLIGVKMEHVTHESEPLERKLNRVYIIDQLQELGIDILLVDWINHDDNEILGDLATYAAILDIEFDDLLEACGIEIEEGRN